MPYRVFFSNIGYAKGIDGSLWQHMCRAGRHVYCSVPLQQQVLGQLKTVINTQSPDICCLVEIDRGSFHSAYYNQMDFLLGDKQYPFHDVSDKYGPSNWLSLMPLHRGKSNAFLAKNELPFERLYFASGSKRLIYRIELENGIHLFFAHFSLNRDIRKLQMKELHDIVKKSSGEIMIMADFNIMDGFKELEPLMNGTDLKVMNDADTHTFSFHRYRWTLDLCLCSESLAKRTKLHVIPQPFSDHAALMAEIEEP